MICGHSPDMFGKIHAGVEKADSGRSYALTCGVYFSEISTYRGEKTYQFRDDISMYNTSIYDKWGKAETKDIFNPEAPVYKKHFSRGSLH